MRRRLLAVVLGLIVIARPASSQAPATTMTVHFIDVGQALATLVEFPCGAMLVDAGSQDDVADRHLIAYLNDFFKTRPDLNRTFEEVLITHNHIDHTNSLQHVVENFTVKRFIDHGFTTGSGSPRTNWLKKQVKDHVRTIQVRSIKDKEITDLPSKTGLTDGFIDPFNCDTVDPVVRILSGRLATNPGWSQKDFANLNNHSLVTRIDFGAASVLFMGDMEIPASDLLLHYYSGQARQMLDTDVLQVAHHGSRNGTSQALVDAVTPKVAVIPVGHWSDGRNPKKQFSTYAYGHPNQDALDLLSAGIAGNRGTAIEIMAGLMARSFRKTTIRKGIYATDWDGALKVIADRDGTITVVRTHQ
jgi:competence protein ComEC